MCAQWTESLNFNVYEFKIDTVTDLPEIRMQLHFNNGNFHSFGHYNTMHQWMTSYKQL